MKLLLMIAFWGLLGWFLYQLWGWKPVVIEILFILFINLVTWDAQMKKLKDDKGKE